MRLGLVRLSLRPPGGQGEPYGDDVVEQARAMVEGATLSQKQIGAAIGISHMTVCRWTRAGNWRRPPGSPRRFMRRSEVPRKGDGTPWRLLREAEALVEQGADLDRLERALALVLEARELAGEGGEGEDVGACCETMLRASSA